MFRFLTYLLFYRHLFLALVFCIVQLSSPRPIPPPCCLPASRSSWSPSPSPASLPPASALSSSQSHCCPPCSASPRGRRIPASPLCVQREAHQLIFVAGQKYLRGWSPQCTTPPAPCCSEPSEEQGGILLPPGCQGLLPARQQEERPTSTLHRCPVGRTRSPRLPLLHPKLGPDHAKQTSLARWSS